jgi:sugar lactone lactonase YvrE
VPLVPPDGSLLVADSGNNRIRRVDSAGNVTTVAGTGGAALFDGTAGLDGTAMFNIPIGVAIDAIGNIYVVTVPVGSIQRTT